MKASQIITQLMAALPQYTTLFSDSISITALSYSGSTATVTTATAHGLTVGTYVNITGVKIRNPLVSLTQVDNVATAVTQYNHDLTMNSQYEPDQYVNISGAVEVDYNGDKLLLSVPNRKTFTFQIENDPASPATGTPIFNEVRSYNAYEGVKAITAVPTTTTFQYAISTNLPTPATGTMVALFNHRVSGAFAIEPIVDYWYSKQPSQKMWAFVTLEAGTASKDRATLSDGTQTTTAQTIARQRIITPFSVYVFAAAPNDTDVTRLSLRNLRDQMEDIFHYLSKSLLRTRFQTVFSEPQWAQTVFVSHDTYSYNESYYVHRYSFETTFDIVYADTIAPDPNVAFRDIDMNFQRLNDTYVIATASVNLDEEPLP